LGTMTTDAPPTTLLRPIVGYDGSPPADRALDAAVRLMQGRTGGIEVLYVAHLSSMVMLSADAIAEVESDFDEIQQELRTQAAGHLDGRVKSWEFHRRQGAIAGELIAAAVGAQEAHPGDVVMIVVGSSSHASHRVIGSVAVSLARHSPVPLIIVP
jgi:nucleotide-binding universal stress UspA family protein